MSIDAALGRLGIQTGVCTSSTRPANPYEGQVIYETDTNRSLVYDNAAWVVIANASPTGFPTSLDTNTVDSIAALQAKVGIDSSAVTSSLDYKVAQLEALGTPVAYTPSHNNITVGNGTEIARYMKIGKLVLVSYKLTWGSTTSFSNYPNVGLPFTANAVAFGSGMMTDTGSSNYQMLIVVDSGTNSVSIRGHNISGTYARADSFTNATTPFTWTTGDILQFSIVYEAQ